VKDDRVYLGHILERLDADYLGISLSRVWDITQRDLPALRAAVVPMLAELDTRGPTP
jgi:uncharacterized protein with HEPN domain